LPFERLVEDVGARDLSRSSVFQVLFNQEPVPQQAAVGDLVAQRMIVDPGVSKFDIAITLRSDEKTGAVNGSLEYSTGLFDAASIDRLAGHYVTLLEGVIAEPDARISDLPLLTAAERAVQAAWNATTREYPAVAIHTLIQEQARRTPDRVAVQFEDRLLTYRALDEQSDHVCRCLRARGVAAGVRVGIFMERSPELVVAVLGVLKSGAAYVPLDPSFPRDRLAHILADSGAAVVLTERSTVARIPCTTASIVTIDDDGMIPDATPPPPVSPDTLAYVIYTSGSTGKPKGVAVTHRSLGNLLESMGREPGVAVNDVLLSVTSLSFDIAALELFLPLIKGARVVVATGEDVSDGRRLMQRLVASGITVMQATPATWRLLIEAGWEGSPDLKVLCGGEALSRQLADDLLRRAGEVWNLYGPTETTVWSSLSRVTPGDSPIAIGRPIANTQMWVLDPQLKPLPVGIPGELYIGGGGLAQGYWDCPDLTDAKFTPDPFSSEPGSRLYRTGDRARRLPDGRVEWLGRFDFQVKLRGFRIELEEIEAAIRRHPAIREVVVVMREDTPGDKRLVAYLVADDARSDLVEQVRALLRLAIPQHMMPAAFLILARLPLTPNGKIDRTALPAPGATEGQVPAVVVAPRTASEQLVFDVFCDVLGRADFGVLDSFFDLGGHSLMAARLTSRVQAASGVDVQLRSLFEHPTPAGLAELIDSWSWLARSTAALADDSGREEVEL
jgi:amino acid adenylation domain-containing protein